MKTTQITVAAQFWRRQDYALLERPNTACTASYISDVLGNTFITYQVEAGNARDMDLLNMPFKMLQDILVVSELEKDQKGGVNEVTAGISEDKAGSQSTVSHG